MFKGITSGAIANIASTIIILGLVYVFTYHTKIDNNTNAMTYIEKDVKELKANNKEVSTQINKLKTSDAVQENKIKSCCDK